MSFKARCIDHIDESACTGRRHPPTFLAMRSLNHNEIQLSIVWLTCKMSVSVPTTQRCRETTVVEAIIDRYDIRRTMRQEVSRHPFAPVYFNL